MLTTDSGLELLPLHLGASIRAVNVSVLQAAAVLHAVVDALHLLDVAVVISLPERTIAETVTETTIVETEATDPVVQMTGKDLALDRFASTTYVSAPGTEISRMSETVIARKFERTAPMAKTGKVILYFRLARRTKLADNQMAVAMDSPPPAHDELDTAE
jgi:hypothetical protein